MLDLAGHDLDRDKGYILTTERAASISMPARPLAQAVRAGMDGQIEAGAFTPTKGDRLVFTGRSRLILRT
jgi:hypothetical protein